MCGYTTFLCGQDCTKQWTWPYYFCVLDKVDKVVVEFDITKGGYREELN